jgi:signal transduction histidine kinase
MSKARKQSRIDIRILLTRTAFFMGVYLIALGLPFALAVWGKAWLIEMFGAGWWFAPMFLVAVLTTLGPFIYIYFERKAEKVLLREQRRYQDTLKQAAVGMTRFHDLNKILNLIVRILTRTVKIAFAEIYLYDEQTGKFVVRAAHGKGAIQEAFSLGKKNIVVTYLRNQQDPLVYKKELPEEVRKELDSMEAAVIVPSFLDNKLTGLLVLGDKTSGRPYTPEDLNVLYVLASQAAMAIENVQFIEKAKVLQEQVAYAEKMATIGTLADGLSHQINNRFNTLSIIAGDIIDTLKLTDISDYPLEAKELLSQIDYGMERIKVNINQGKDMIDGILRYSRQAEIDFRPLGIDDILDGALEMVQYKIKLSDIDVVRSYPVNMPKIKGNLTQLQEVFFNLIDNAYDAIKEKSLSAQDEAYRGRILINASKGDGGVLQIAFEDNGIGIKEDDQHKLFTPFFTTKASSKKGSGLGLYVIQRIITQMHNGKIAFDSAHMTGTRFLVELPLARAHHGDKE